MVSTKSILRFLSTVKYLRSQQIVSQARNRLKLVYEKHEKFCSKPAPDFCKCRWRTKQDFLSPGLQNNSATDILAGRLSFLNNEQNIGLMPDWNRNDLPKLWLYNLHYLDYLWALDYAKSKVLVLDWIDNCPLRQNRLAGNRIQFPCVLLIFAAYSLANTENKPKVIKFFSTNFGKAFIFRLNG